MKEWKGNEQTASEAFMRSFTLSKTKNLNPLFRNASLWILEFITGSWRLSNCHIQELKKINLFKMLDFQRTHFSRKRPLKCATLFAQPNCENKSFEPDHQIPSQYPIQKFLTVITIFLGALSKKEDDFSWIINQVLRIFWFQVLWKPCFENKGNFWINRVCIKAFVS